MIILVLRCSRRMLLAYLGFKIFGRVLKLFAARFFA